MDFSDVSFGTCPFTLKLQIDGVELEDNQSIGAFSKIAQSSDKIDGLEIDLGEKSNKGSFILTLIGTDANDSSHERSETFTVNLNYACTKDDLSLPDSTSEGEVVLD